MAEDAGKATQKDAAKTGPDSAAGTPFKADAASVTAAEKGQEQPPQAADSQSAGPPRKRAGRKEYAITFAVLAYFIWQFGLVGSAYSLFIGLLPETPPEISQNFNVIQPGIRFQLEAASGDLSAEFKNVGIDNATVNSIYVRDLDGGRCQVDTALPLTLAEGQLFNVTARGCAGSALAGRSYNVGFIFNGTTTVRTRFMSDEQILTGPAGRSGTNPRDMDRMRSQIQEQLKYMDGGLASVEFTSMGTLTGTYD
jgi:hypothetical protein